MGAELRVAVVDDHATVSELMARALDHEPGIRCVGTAASAAAARLLVRVEKPDAVIMDVQLGADDGIALTAELVAEQPGLRVVILTALTAPALVQRAAAAGACSLLPKNGALDDVVGALRTAAYGGLMVHPQLLRELVTASGTRAVASPALTGRELDVLRLLGDGRTVRQIAVQLTISEHTARGHVKKLLQKLDAHSQLEAVAVATKLGLLT
jgi:DNA-binding NarL/FixJ family response regulator